MILEEFDKTKKAIFNPDNMVSIIKNFPKVGITCFSKKLFDQLVNKYNGKIIVFSSHSDGNAPIYKINYKDKQFALFLSKVGAPACVACFENLFAMGLEKIVVFGTCGVLDKDICDLSIIIPNCAIRDEGTSYHYVKASREINVNLKYLNIFVKILEKRNISYTIGKVWTTDAPYRETVKKTKKRKNEGCICVDMECSAIASLAAFRKKEIFQFFYAADNLDSEKWKIRSLKDSDKLSFKEKIGDLAVEIAMFM